MIAEGENMRRRIEFSSAGLGEYGDECRPAFVISPADQAWLVVHDKHEVILVPTGTAVLDIEYQEINLSTVSTAALAVEYFALSS